MRVEGVDPLVINQVVDLAKQPLVRDAFKVGVSAEEERSRHGPKEQVPKGGHLEQTIEKLNAATDLFNVKLRFRMDYEKNEVYVLVIDCDDHKVIRRVPPDEVCKISEQIEQMVGLLLDNAI